MTNITEEHRRAFDALTSGTPDMKLTDNDGREA